MRQMWFLNGRALRDKILTRALKEAYRGVLMEGRQPVAFLNLAMDPIAVDVNVHPTKSEVRFRDERRLMGFLIAKLRDVVRAAAPRPSCLGQLTRLALSCNRLTGPLPPDLSRLTSLVELRLDGNRFQVT